MDAAQKREIPLQSSNLKRGWVSPNDHFDTHIKIHSNTPAERAREHLRAGYQNGILTPAKKKIRANEDTSEFGLERHIFPRIYASPGKCKKESKIFLLKAKSRFKLLVQTCNTPSGITQNCNL